jgi:hypothetical protein
LGKNIFNYYDKDKSKTLNLKEFKQMVNELYEKTRIKLFLNKEKQVINEYCNIDLNSDGLISQNGMAL